MKIRQITKSDMHKFLCILTAEKDRRRPMLPLAELIALVAAMIALMFYDPFRITEKIMDALRLGLPLCTKEPRFLYYASTYLGTFVFKVIMLAFIAVLLVVDRIEAEDELAIKRPRDDKWKGYIVPFVILSAFLRTSYSANPLIANLPLRLITPSAMLIGDMIIIFSVALVAPVTEEIIFRGYMYDILKRGFGAYVSIGITALLFALAHLPQLSSDISGFFIILALGCIFGLARQRTGSILPPIIFHAIYNSVYIIIGIVNFLTLGY